MIDLHTHTTISDGAFTPRELIDRAIAYKLTAIAICDHDSIGAYSPDLFSYARDKGVELIPGIELSATTEAGKSYHIAGLFIDLESVVLRDVLERLQKNRRGYVAKAIAALKDGGFSVDETYLKAESVTKAHIARGVVRNPINQGRLMREFGRVPAEGQFIETYMSSGQKCFVERVKDFTPVAAIKNIHEAGGLAFLAHPASYVVNGENLRNLCDEFRRLGIDGFEVYNVQYDRSHHDDEVDLSKDVAAYCEEFNLLQSGGSDFHTDDESVIGKFIDLGFNNHIMKMPDDLLAKMRLFSQKRSR